MNMLHINKKTTVKTSAFIALFYLLITGSLLGQTTSDEVGSKQGYSEHNQWNEVIETSLLQSVVQSLYLSDELDSAGLNANGVVIKGIQFKVAQVPGRNMDEFRIAYTFTNDDGLTNWEKGLDVVYGPVSVNTGNLAIDTWKQFDFSSYPIWNGTDNIVIEFSFSNGNWTGGGGVWSWNTGDGNRTLRWEDNTYHSYPYYDQNIGFVTEPWIPGIKLIYEIPAVYSPEKLVANASYKQVDLVWNKSKTDSIDSYLIYRGSSEGTLALLDSNTTENDTTYLDTGLTNGTPYFYGVKAVKGTDTSYVSNIVSATPEYLGPVWWVDDDGSGLDGSEADPFTNLSTALNKAENGDTIRIKAGTYSGSNNREIVFDETTLVIESEHPDSSVIFDAGSVNARHFEFDKSAQDSNTFYVKGITFINGAKTNDWENGGSIRFSNGSATFENCTFRNNTATGWSADGGAVSIENNQSPRFIDCVFEGNAAVRWGGAIAVEGHYSRPSFENTSIVNNEVIGFDQWNTASGGGVAIKDGSPIFEYCRIDSNIAGSGSGPWQEGNGGGVYISGFSTWDIPEPRFFATTFIANEAVGDYGNGFGGAINAYAGLELVNCLIAWNSAYTTGSDNNTAGLGGAVRFGSNIHYPAEYSGGWRDSLEIINCTIVDNEARSTNSTRSSEGGGLYFDQWYNDGDDQKLFIMNTILTGNEADNNPNFADVGYPATTIYAGYNNIEDGLSFTAWFDENDSWDINSGFANPGTGNYSLVDESPIIGEGITNLYGLSAPVSDIIGATRGTPPDIGAYENAYTTSPAPLPVADLDVTEIGNQSVTLGWSADAEAENYKVYFGTVSGFTRDKADSSFTVSGTEASVTVTGLTNLTKYFFLVTAINAGGWESLVSYEVEGTPEYVGPVWWVDDDATANGSLLYGNQSDPLLNLTKALEKAENGDTIRIKAGTYSGPNNREIVFDETTLVIESEHPDSSIVFDAGTTTGARHFEFNKSGQDSNTFYVKGITFINGDKNSAYENGGSIRFSNGSAATFENCAFRDNAVTGNWSNGGAVSIDNDGSAPRFVDCRFEYNSATEGGGAIAINGHTSAPVFINTIIRNNEVTGFDAGQRTQGGGVAVYDGSPVFENCRIDSNIAGTNTETGWNNSRGGGLFIENYNTSDIPDIRISGTTFIGNEAVGDNGAGEGGALNIGADTELINCLIAWNEAYTTATNSFNTAYGGGIRAAVTYWDPNQQKTIGGTVKMINCTIVDNEARSPSTQNSRGGGIYLDACCDGTQTLVLFNSILTGNVADSEPNLADNSSPLTRMDAGFNNIENGFSFTTWFDESNSWDINPGFTDPEAGDYSLVDASPLIGAGTANFEGAFAAPEVDILGASRGTPPDIGAYENAYTTSPAPLPVADLEVIDVGNQNVTLKWAANADADSYRVYIGLSAGFIPGEADSSFTVSGTETSVQVAGLTNLTKYFFLVTAINENDWESLVSHEVEGTPYGPWYVGKDGNNSNPGMEDQPFATLKKALEVAMEGDTIKIKPSGDTPYSGFGFRALNGTHLKDGIVIISTHGPDSTVISTGGSDRHMTFDDGQDTTFKVIGLTFTDGRAKQSDRWDSGNDGIGGSVRIGNASPYFENCVFENNSATAGGGAIGVYNSSAKPVFKDCRFTMNSVTQLADWGAYIYYGGGAVFFNTGSGIFKGCLFDSNEVNTESDANHSGFGGAILVEERSVNEIDRVKILGSEFRGNKINVQYFARGSAVYTAAPLMISNSLFHENKTVSIENYNNDGAAIAVELAPFWDNFSSTYVISPVVIKNSTITNNEQGGIWNTTRSWFTPLSGDQLILFNNIIWGNESAGVWDYDPNNSRVQASNNNIQNASWLATVPWFNDNPNVSVYPLFADYSAGDYTLSDRSYLIGGGTASFAGWSAPNVDITGKARPTPSGSSIDLGAYENDLDITPAPGLVKGLALTGTEDQSVSLEWEAPSDSDLAYYIVYGSETDGFIPTDSDSLTRTDSVETVITVTGLTNQVNYYFRVSAVDADGWTGGWSDLAEGTPNYPGPWYVATDGNDTNEGTPEEPVKTIKKALELAVSGDTVFISPGTYTGAGNWNLQDDVLKNGLVITSTHGSDSTIISAGNQGRHMTFDDGQDTTFKVVGLTFTDGEVAQIDNWDSNEEGMGGSIKIGNASPYFENCVFVSNTATAGGGAVGVFSDDAQPVFNNCRFEKNSVTQIANWSAYSYYGGGAAYMRNGSGVFLECTFDSNAVNTAGDANHWGHGGAILVGDYDYRNVNRVRISRSTFTDNSVNVRHDARGGAVYTASPMVISNSLFTGNRTFSIDNNNNDGAAIAVELVPYWDNFSSYVISPVVIKNSTITNNEQGGIWNKTRYWETPLSGDQLILFNNISWGNEGNGIWDYDSDNSRIRASNNDIEGADGYNWFHDHENVDIPPLFKDAENGDFSLDDRSYLIGRGISSFEGFNAPAVDINGRDRPTPPGSNPDLGAYEHDFDETPAPGRVTNLAVTDEGHQYVSLSWDAPADTDLDHYIIYYSNMDGFIPEPADSLTRTSETETNIKLTGLENGVIYYFRIAAADQDGWIGMASKQVEGKPRYEGPWYVNTAGNDVNEGSAEEPFASLNQALMHAVEGDSILIGAGTYTGINNVNIQSVDLRNGLTILSAAGPGLAVFDAEHNSRHMHFGDNQDTTLKIIGLKFINGSAWMNDNNLQYWDPGWNDSDGNKAQGAGGSIIIGNDWFENNQREASPMFIDCIFEDNHSARAGGAVFISQGHPVFRNVTFTGNGAMTGGAVFVNWPWNGARSAIFEECNFINNGVWTDKTDSYSFGSGGAVFIQPNGNFNDEFFFDRCFFNGNQAEYYGGNDHEVRGGAISSESNVIVQNCLFDGNVVMSDQRTAGGAINMDVNMDGNGGYGTLINNTFVNNRSVVTSGNNENAEVPAVLLNAWNSVASSYSVFNNIFWGNTRSEGQEPRSPIELWHSGSFDVQADYNLLQYAMGSEFFDNSHTLHDVNPGFMDYAGGDYSLDQFSPALEAGIDNFNGWAAPDVDIRGEMRSLPPETMPDLGAYEAGPAMHVVMTLDSEEVKPDDMKVIEYGDTAVLALTIQSWDDPPIPAEDGTPIEWVVFPEMISGITLLKMDTATVNGFAAVSFRVENEAVSGQGFVIQAEVDKKFFVFGPKLFVNEIVTDPPPPPQNLTVYPDYWTPQNDFTLTWDPTDWINGIRGAFVAINGSSPEYFPIDNASPSIAGQINQQGAVDVSVWLIDNLDNESPDSASHVLVKRDATNPTDIAHSSPAGWTQGYDVNFTWGSANDGESGIMGYQIDFGSGDYWNNPSDRVPFESHEIHDANSWVYQGQLPTNVTWYSVVAFDSARNYSTNLFVQNLMVDMYPPNLSFNYPGDVFQEGQNINMDINWSDNESGIGSVQIVFRAGDQTEWNYHEISGGGFVGIQGQDVYTAGLEYYIIAHDQVGNFTRDPQDEYSTYSVRVQTNQYDSYDFYPNGMHAGQTVGDYQIIAVPLERNNNSANTVFEEFQPVDNTQWRYYGYDPGSGNYMENPGSINPGQGYFLITRNQNRNLRTGQGTSFPLDQGFEIGVMPNQWNFIGNPFDFDIPLSAISLKTGGDIYTEGSFFFFYGDWDSSPNTMYPFEGFIYKPTSATSIIIDPKRAMEGGKMVAAKELVAFENEPEEGEWQIQVDVENSSARDNLNIMGTRKEALSIFDSHDAFEPPAVPGGISMGILSMVDDTRKDRLAIDMQPVNQDGHFWDLDVTSATGGVNVDLKFNQLGTVPEEFEIFLVDMDLKIAQNLRWKDTYRYTSEMSGKSHNMRLLAGRKDFVEENSGGVDLYPEEFALSQNFPNPFNPRTSLILSMKEKGSVDLTVYNILGQEVMKLVSNDYRPAGYYNIMWNGVNNHGERVATGTYLMVAQVRDDSGKIKLKEVRKMLLLK